MKKVFLLYLILIVGTSQGFSSLLFVGNDQAPDSVKAEAVPENELDKIVSIKARYFENRIFFNLLVLNETKNSVYSLVREFENGSFESVDVRNGYMNQINTPLLYSFVDKEIPNVDFTYALYRISKESVVLQKWKYCYEDNQLCPLIEETVAEIN